MGINGSTMRSLSAIRMRSGRLEGRELERRRHKRHTRDSVPGVKETKGKKTMEMMETSSHGEEDQKKKIVYKTEWFSARKKFVCPVTLECVETEDECPILMEPFHACKMDFKPNLAYEIKGSDGTIQVYNKVTIDGCQHSFFPLALAMHWMVHSMRCPLCKYGSDSKLSSTCLPINCAVKLLSQVRKIKNEMEEDIFMSDVQLVQDIRFGEDMEIVGNISGEHFPHAILIDVIPLQNWDIINEHMRLHVMLHYESDLISQERVLSALDSLGATNQWRVERSSEDTEMFTVQGYLSLCEDTLITDDPTFGFMNIPRSQCRLISRINQVTKPTSMSCSLVYQDPSITLTICKMTHEPARCIDDTMLFNSSRLMMEDEGDDIVGGYLETQWMPGEISSPGCFGYGILWQRVIVDKEMFIKRVTRTKIILYLMENEMLMNEGQLL
eukprot:767165-Hanusia_phi.AAC.2